MCQYSDMTVTIQVLGVALIINKKFMPEKTALTVIVKN